MELDNYFTAEWTIDDFLDTVIQLPEEENKEQNVPLPCDNMDQTMPPDLNKKGQFMTPKILKSPRRKTFGALINELKEEIRDLKLEIEIRDAYIFAMLNELKNKKT